MNPVDSVCVSVCERDGEREKVRDRETEREKERDGWIEREKERVRKESRDNDGNLHMIKIEVY